MTLTHVNVDTLFFIICFSLTMWPVLSPEGEKAFPPFDFSPPFLSLRVRKQSKGYGRKGNTSLLGGRRRMGYGDKRNRMGK